MYKKKILIIASIITEPIVTIYSNIQWIRGRIILSADLSVGVLQVVLYLIQAIITRTE